MTTLLLQAIPTFFGCLLIYRFVAEMFGFVPMFHIHVSVEHPNEPE